MPHLNPVAELPDGRFGYYEQRDDDGQIIESFLAVPSHVDKYWYLDDQALEPKPSIEITIFKDGAQTKATKTTPINVICAAYASGILMVGGQTDDFRATIAASIDDGDTWEIVWSGPEDVYQQVNTISAAPLSDL
jgi:hypothetical protein